LTELADDVAVLAVRMLADDATAARARDGSPKAARRGRG
jgi:hypothetical protein